MLEDGAVLVIINLCQQILREKHQYWIIQDSLDMVLSLVLCLGSLLSPEGCSAFPLSSMTSVFLYPYQYFLPGVQIIMSKLCKPKRKEKIMSLKNHSHNNVHLQL